MKNHKKKPAQKINAKLIRKVNKALKGAEKLMTDLRRM
jgi:hypothetical protein